MSSVESEGQSKKRYREEELVVLEDFLCDPWECLSKRACTISRALAEDQHDHSVLDDLYGLVTLPEGYTLESYTQEAPVSEMARDLERVIANEEASLLHATYGNSSELVLNRSLTEKAQFYQEDCESTQPESKTTSISNSPVDMKFLFEASDDELGIPPSPNSVGENACCVSEDASWLDTNYPELSEKDIEVWKNSPGNNSYVVETLESEGRIASEEENYVLGLSSDCLW